MREVVREVDGKRERTAASKHGNGNVILHAWGGGRGRAMAKGLCFLHGRFSMSLGVGAAIVICIDAGG